MRGSFVALMVMLAGCAHTSVAVNSGGSSASGTRAVSSGGSVQVSASGAVAAAIVAGAVIAATVNDPSEPEPFPRYRSLAEWFSGPPAPEMDPSRTVNEQDCTKPITGSGNLRCR